MHYFLLPLVPLTIVGAIFFKNRLAAYGFPVVLTLIKMFMTQVTPMYLFMALGLLAVVFAARKINQGKLSLMKVAGTAALGVFFYALASNFGVWFLGSCVPEAERLYAFNFSGLLACYKASLPYAGIHLLKAVPLTLVLVQIIDWIRQKNFVLSLQRLLLRKAS